MSFSGGYGDVGGSGDRGGPGPGLADAEAAMTQMQSQIQAETMQELVQEITDKCFEKCIPKPGPSLSGGEQTCLARCYDRYMECMTVVYSSLAKQANANSDGR